MKINTNTYFEKLATYLSPAKVAFELISREGKSGLQRPDFKKMKGG